MRSCKHLEVLLCYYCRVAQVYTHRQTFTCRELDLAARLIYSFTSTAVGQQTPGEEYCDILQVAGASSLQTSLQSSRLTAEGSKLDSYINLTRRICCLVRIPHQQEEASLLTEKYHVMLAENLQGILLHTIKNVSFAGRNLRAPGKLRRTLLSILEACGPYLEEEIQVNPGC